jgi:hypothetical protein
MQKVDASKTQATNAVKQAKYFFRAAPLKMADLCQKN